MERVAHANAEGMGHIERVDVMEIAVRFFKKNQFADIEQLERSGEAASRFARASGDDAEPPILRRAECDDPIRFAEIVSADDDSLVFIYSHTRSLLVDAHYGRLRVLAQPFP